MMYSFLTLDDNTEIVHSEMLADGRVKVYIEKPDEKVIVSDFEGNVLSEELGCLNQRSDGTWWIS